MAQPAGNLPLSALLSQLLVAYTVEFDNEFEARMAGAGFPGRRLSLMIFANLVRFIQEGGTSVYSLVERSLAPKEAVVHQLGCLERWGYIALRPENPAQRASQKRPGWGSGRGIKLQSVIELTPAGTQASQIWPPLFAAIDARWRERFGASPFTHLRQALERIERQIPFELPLALPGLHAPPTYPAREGREPRPLSLPALLARVLLAFRLDFETFSPTPFALCANPIRVLSENPIPESDLPRLTGCSPETAGVGWQLKPYIRIEPAPPGARGKTLRLSPAGLRAQHVYAELCAAIERQWESRFGRDDTAALRHALSQIRDATRAGQSLLSAGLAGSPETVRGGRSSPALGRRSLGPAAVKRNRDTMTQTEAYARDPLGSLPHYPLWDMNRGFGP